MTRLFHPRLDDWGEHVTRRGGEIVGGERNTQKILGASALADGQFAYRHQTEYFNTQTYIRFLDEVVLPTFYRRGRRVYLIHLTTAEAKAAYAKALKARARHPSASSATR